MTARVSTSSKAGYCNFCNRHIHPWGGSPHEVIEMGGAGLLARICQPCVKEVMPLLVMFADVSPRNPTRNRYRNLSEKG